MRKVIDKINVLVLAVSMVFAAIAAADAQMRGPVNSMMPGGTSTMTNSGGFGMMNGMAGTPVVADDGTAFLVSMNPTANPGTAPTSNSFESKIVAVTPTGEVNALTLRGIVSRPVTVGNVLVATASLPDFNNYTMMGNFGANSSSRQSVLYVVSLPLSGTSVPSAVTLDGSFASLPVISNNRVYVTTTDFGNAMMQGNTMFSNFNFNNTASAKSYLYIIDLDGSAPLKIEIQ